MEITNTDRKWINELFKAKPDATGKDLLVLIERMARTDMRGDVRFLMQREIDDIVKGTSN